MKNKIILFACLMFALPSFGADISTNKLLIRGVDKVTGKVNTMTANINEEIEFGKLKILPKKCLTKPKEEMPENAAFFTIHEKQENGEERQVFNGWMFSSNPALSAMEHPIYDVWVLECITEEVENPYNPVVIAEELDINLIAEEDNPALAEEEIPSFTLE